MPEKFEQQFEKPFAPQFKDSPEAKEKELSKEEKEKREIETIEQSSLSLQDKEDLLLVYLGEKPAAWFPAEDRFYKTEPDEEKEKILEELRQKREEAKEIIETLDLSFNVKEFETEEEKTINKGFYFSVGQDLEKLNRLKEALKSGTNKELGSALGYPESAVEGFIKGEVFDREKDLKRLPKTEREELKKEGVFKFLNFGLSKNNWREELELVRNYQRAIQEKSPKIYNEIIKTERDPFMFRGRLETTFERIMNRIEYYKRGLKKEIKK